MLSHHANAIRLARTSLPATTVLHRDKMSIAQTVRLNADFQPCLIDYQEWKATRAALASETGPKLFPKMTTVSVKRGP